MTNAALQAGAANAAGDKGTFNNVAQGVKGETQDNGHTRTRRVDGKAKDGDRKLAGGTNTRGLEQ